MAVFRDADKFSSSVHRKDTFSGVYTKFKSFMPETYKSGLVSTLLYRGFMICSSFQSLHKEIEKLKIIFSNKCSANEGPLGGYLLSIPNKWVFFSSDQLTLKNDSLKINFVLNFS